MEGQADLNGCKVGRRHIFKENVNEAWEESVGKE